MKTAMAIVLASAAAFVAVARPCSTPADWHTPVCDAHRCETCESYSRALKILKGQHLIELRTVMARHAVWCPYQIARRSGKKISK